MLESLVNLGLSAFSRRQSDRLPLAERIRAEHEADLGAILRQADRSFHQRHGRTQSAPVNAVGPSDAVRQENAVCPLAA